MPDNCFTRESCRSLKKGDAVKFKNSPIIYHIEGYQFDDAGYVMSFREGGGPPRIAWTPYDGLIGAAYPWGETASRMSPRNISVTERLLNKYKDMYTNENYTVSPLAELIIHLAQAEIERETKNA